MNYSLTKKVSLGWYSGILLLSILDIFGIGYSLAVENSASVAHRAEEKHMHSFYIRSLRFRHTKARISLSWDISIPKSEGAPWTHSSSTQKHSWFCKHLRMFSYIIWPIALQLKAYFNNMNMMVLRLSLFSIREHQEYFTSDNSLN